MGVAGQAGKIKGSVELVFLSSPRGAKMPVRLVPSRPAELKIAEAWAFAPPRAASYPLAQINCSAPVDGRSQNTD